MTKQQFSSDTSSLSEGDRVVVTYRPIVEYKTVGRIGHKQDKPEVLDGTISAVHEEEIYVDGKAIHYIQVTMIRS